MPQPRVPRGTARECMWGVWTERTHCFPGETLMKLRFLEAPYVGWFHLGAEEARRAGEVLRRLDAVEDSVDELGFGILRDGFAEQFFPGTNTVMTEVRYLMFMAAIYG